MSGIREPVLADRLPIGAIILEEGTNPKNEAYVVWCLPSHPWRGKPAVLVFCRWPGRPEKDMPGLFLNTEQLEAMLVAAKTRA